jgi:hypothetical protein
LLIPELHDSKDDFANATLDKASSMKSYWIWWDHIRQKRRDDKFESDIEKMLNLVVMIGLS